MGAVTRDVVIIGGGIAGLAAAWRLRHRDLLLLEAGDRLGGRLRSDACGDYWLNYGAHLFPAPGSLVDAMARECGLETVPVTGGMMGLAVGRTILDRGRVETYPFRLPLSLRDRLALLRTGARLRLAVWRYGRTAARRPGDTDESRRLRILSYRDDTSFAQFLGPVPGDVDALIRPTIERSSAEPEDVSAGYGIGYFQLVWDRTSGLTRNVLGGSARLPETLAAALGDRVRTGARATSAARDGGGVRIRYTQEGAEQEVRARFAILAAPAHVTASIASDLPVETRDALARITYGPYVVAAFLTGEDGPMPYDGIYAVATPKRSFNMLFNTANVLRGPGPREPGGSLMVYSGASLAQRLEGRSDDEVRETYLRDLEELFPALRGKVAETAIVRWPRGLPHPRPGRHLLQPALERPVAPFFLAGDYLGTTYVETAIQTGAAAARAVHAALSPRAA
jgi:oxygen-dependent protoporphyrinogen oxidase